MTVSASTLHQGQVDLDHRQRPEQLDQLQGLVDRERLRNPPGHDREQLTENLSGQRDVLAAECFGEELLGDALLSRLVAVVGVDQHVGVEKAPYR